ncbi:MAG TPA: hypothetical protein QGF58_24110 [Myxococcota bacterium]|nr:hypothetical protein [Myxococcota bacterium]
MRGSEGATWLTLTGLLAGCGGRDGESTSGEAQLADENNYSYAAALHLPRHPTAEAEDLALDWSGLEQDLRCAELNPAADIDNLLLVSFPALSPEEVEEGLAHDSLLQADLGGYVTHEPGDATTASLSDFGFNGADVGIVDRYTAEDTWLLTLATGLELTLGTRWLAFLDPAPDQTATAVDLAGDCDVLDVSAVLTELVPVAVAAEGPWVLDWSGLEQDGRGNALALETLDQLTVARYDETPAELEDRFLELEALAIETWTLDIDGIRSASLEDATDASGAPLSGFRDSTTWILALRCLRCSNPVPPFLTILEPLPVRDMD